MNQTSIQNKTVLAIVGLSIAVAFSMIGSQAMAAPSPNFIQYGQVAAQEDELYFIKDGYYYVNAILPGNEGMFMKITDLDNDYSIDQAIDRFGIDEDIQEFTVQPSLLSNATFLFQLDENLQFQMTGVFSS